MKFADQLNRTILTVRLEPVQLAHGLNMLLSQYQMLDVAASDFTEQLRRALTRYLPDPQPPSADNAQTDATRTVVATDRVAPTKRAGDGNTTTTRPGRTPARGVSPRAAKPATKPPTTASPGAALRPTPERFAIGCGVLGWVLGTALATVLMLSDHSLSLNSFASGALVVGGPAAFGGLWAAPRLWRFLPQARESLPLDPGSGSAG